MNSIDYIGKKFDELSEDEKADAIESLHKRFTHIDTVTDKTKIGLAIDDLEWGERLNSTFGRMSGLSSGYPKVDYLTHGFVGGELIVIAGKTSYGKTTLALNMANEMALQNHPVMFVTLEMTRGEIVSRLLFLNGGKTDSFFQVASMIALQHSAELNWTHIDALIAHAKNELGVEIVMIDHLQYFSRSAENTAEELGKITKQFKQNAIAHDIPIVLVSHVRKTGKERATMEDLRGSSLIGQDADVVLMIGRDTEDASKLYVVIEKNRNRGYNYNDNSIELRLDKIKLYNS